MSPDADDLAGRWFRRMVTYPPGPVYPVMVIVPLLVVSSNCACTTAGNANSSSPLAQAVLKRRPSPPNKAASGNVCARPIPISYTFPIGVTVVGEDSVPKQGFQAS